MERFCYGHDDDRPLQRWIVDESPSSLSYLQSLSSLDEAPNLAFVYHFVGRANMDCRKTQEAHALLLVSNTCPVAYWKELGDQ